MSDVERINCPTCKGYGWKDVAIREHVTGEWRQDVVRCDSCNGHGYLFRPTPTAARPEAREGPRSDAAGLAVGQDRPERPGAVPGAGK